MQVKILGAGSIGNHLANASRTLGWSVHLCDVDPAALERTQHQIYPGRYGQWDDAIELFVADKAPSGIYDLIVIGTPPDAHMALARAAIRERPRAILIEKPACTPDLSGAQDVYEAANREGVAVFVGYDHVVGKAAEKFEGLAAGSPDDPAQTLDVEFREHWGGIFAAHPWLRGPQDTYLGFWQRGGGATGEHSHALNLWQHFAHVLHAGPVTEVQAMMDFESDGSVEYDKLSLMHLRTEHGLSGRVVQDVVTSPPRKWGRLQRRNSYIEWHCGYAPGTDAVLEGNGNGKATEHRFSKSRPDDFIQELRHLERALASDPDASPLALTRGLDTMLVLAAAHKSAREQRTVAIDYSAGYTPRALT